MNKTVKKKDVFLNVLLKLIIMIIIPIFVSISIFIMNLYSSDKKDDNVHCLNVSTSKKGLFMFGLMGLMFINFAFLLYYTIKFFTWIWKLTNMSTAVKVGVYVMSVLICALIIGPFLIIPIIQLGFRVNKNMVKQEENNLMCIDFENKFKWWFIAKVQDEHTYMKGILAVHICLLYIFTGITIWNMCASSDVNQTDTKQQPSK